MGWFLKRWKGLQDYMPCNVTFSKDKMRAWLEQPNLIQNLVKKFGNHVKNIWSHKMLSAPKFLIVGPMIKNEKMIREYQLGIGILLFLIKHARPDIANVTSKLSTGSDGKIPVAFKEL